MSSKRNLKTTRSFVASSGSDEENEATFENPREFLKSSVARTGYASRHDGRTLPSYQEEPSSPVGMEMSDAPSSSKGRRAKPAKKPATKNRSRSKGPSKSATSDDEMATGGKSSAPKSSKRRKSPARSKSNAKSPARPKSRKTPARRRSASSKDRSGSPARRRARK